MNEIAHASEFLLSERFWSDPTPYALTAQGACVSEAHTALYDHLLFATSGSSGVAKWIALSKEALMVSAHEVNKHLGVDAASTWGLALPVNHVGGFGVIARVKSASCKMQVFSQAWDPQAFAIWAADAHVTHSSLVPTQVHDLVAANCRAPCDIDVVVVGGGMLDEAAGNAARDLGWPVLASYGMTEAASQIATQPLGALEQPYVPSPLEVLPQWQVRSGADGCLEIAGPALFSGSVIDGVYHAREGGWHVTNDRVLITADGLVLQGRADLMVKIAGELIDPLLVESRLAGCLQMDGHRIAVVAMSDDRLESRLELAAERGVQVAALQGAIAAYNESVPRSQRLGAPIWVDEIPRGSLGKIQRATLASMLQEAGRRR